MVISAIVYDQLGVEEEGQETAVVDDLGAVDDAGPNRLDNELLTAQPDVPMAVQDQVTGGDRIALVAHEKDDEDLVTADSLVTADDLVTANDLATVNEPTESSANIYSAYTPPLSETFVDMDDLEPNGGKTAKTNVYAPPINENDVDMEHDPEILEIDKSSTKVELNNAFLDDEEIDRDSQLSEFDTAVEA
ncbi:unnamed protein product [Nippostrongylus brasiliensis]|uniref:TMV resistance protein N-like n=1 Tax=Nippostrongylus brasiliensis TaxID=27835 RepID=A0A0N4Y474_NIPBR|nr:unnamed protein product [Nippostrongylus brasiliensis]